MTISNEKNIIAIKDFVSSNLALRDSADRFFDYIELNRQKKIIIDFKNVVSISRSFAQEYLRRKDIANKIILEKNIPENIEKMFDLVKNSTSKPRIIHFESLKPITV